MEKSRYVIFSKPRKAKKGTKPKVVLSSKDALWLQQSLGEKRSQNPKTEYRIYKVTPYSVKKGR